MQQAITEAALNWIQFSSTNPYGIFYKKMCGRVFGATLISNGISSLYLSGRDFTQEKYLGSAVAVSIADMIGYGIITTPLKSLNYGILWPGTLAVASYRTYIACKNRDLKWLCPMVVPFFVENHYYHSKKYNLPALHNPLYLGKPV
jgi:hypothetical protein